MSDNQLVRFMQEVDGVIATTGVYPMGGSKVKPEDCRNEDAYKHGWNDCASEFTRRICEAEMRAQEGSSADMALLLAADVGWLDDGKLLLNMNDTWAWACADAEEVPADQLPEVARLFRRYGHCGLLYWVTTRRPGLCSEFRDVNRFVDFVRREEELLAREPSSSRRAYMNYAYTLGK